MTHRWSEPAATAARIFDAAADHYDAPANSFWQRFGRRTVDRLHLTPGQRVLDVCCGSGSSLCAAAHAVGPSGHVVGIDVSQRLLDLAWRRALAEGVERRVDLRAAELLTADLPPASFDAVVCVFGIFFEPAMERAAARLWSRVAPGGALALTVWGRGSFEPAESAFWNALGAERPEMRRGGQPWERLETVEELAALYAAAGAAPAETALERGTHRLGSPEDWWTIVLGTAYRGIVDGLAPEARERVREATLAAITTAGIADIAADVVYGVARKPAA